jgi:hypothetical protein
MGTGNNLFACDRLVLSVGEDLLSHTGRDVAIPDRLDAADLSLAARRFADGGAVQSTEVRGGLKVGGAHMGSLPSMPRTKKSLPTEVGGLGISTPPARISAQVRGCFCVA